MLRQRSVKSGPHNSHQRGEFQNPCHYHDDDTFDDFVMMKAITLIMIKTQQSIGLAFVAYPEATLTMDLPPLW